MEKSEVTDLTLRARQHMQTLREVAAGLGERFKVVGGGIFDDLVDALEDVAGDRDYLASELSHLRQQVNNAVAEANEMRARTSNANVGKAQLLELLGRWRDRANGTIRLPLVQLIAETSKILKEAE